MPRITPDLVPLGRQLPPDLPDPVPPGPCWLMDKRLAKWRCFVHFAAPHYSLARLRGVHCKSKHSNLAAMLRLLHSCVSKVGHTAARLTPVFARCVLVQLLGVSCPGDLKVTAAMVAAASIDTSGAATDSKLHVGTVLWAYSWRQLPRMCCLHRPVQRIPLRAPRHK